MRLSIAIPDLGKALAETEKDIERAVTSGMRDAANGLKQDLREDVVAAGLGERLSRTWRGKTFPEMGESAEAAAYVWSRAPKIVDAFDRGVVIRSARGLFLAIPTAAASRLLIDQPAQLGSFVTISRSTLVLTRIAQPPHLPYRGGVVVTAPAARRRSSYCRRG